MRIGILSDIHDNVWKLDAALARLREADLLLCLGDLCAPFIVPQLAEGFPGSIHVVFGNNDGDPFRIAREAARFPHVTLHGEVGTVEAGGVRIALHHLPEVGEAFLGAGRHDLVCWGHTHRYEVRREGSAVGVNPGEVMGRLGAPTCAVFDTATEEVSRVEL